MMLRGDLCPAEISDLLGMLLRMSQSHDTDLRAMGAECLGELGAVDPARVVSLQDIVSDSCSAMCPPALTTPCTLFRVLVPRYPRPTPCASSRTQTWR